MRRCLAGTAATLFCQSGKVAIELQNHPRYLRFSLDKNFFRPTFFSDRLSSVCRNVLIYSRAGFAEKDHAHLSLCLEAKGISDVGGTKAILARLRICLS